MGDTEIGWIAAIIIGGIAGWLAEQFMKSEMGLLMNIILGIVGAAEDARQAWPLSGVLSPRRKLLRFAARDRHACTAA